MTGLNFPDARTSSSIRYSYLSILRPSMMYKNWHLQDFERLNEHQRIEL